MRCVLICRPLFVAVGENVGHCYVCRSLLASQDFAEDLVERSALHTAFHSIALPFLLRYAIPSCELCIFSPSRRQSQKLLNLVRTFLAKLPGAMDRVEKSNAETMWMRGDATEDDRRIVSSYPSSVKTLKGVGGDVARLLSTQIAFHALVFTRADGCCVQIICEEAAAMDTAVFYEVVVPLLELDRTALICISTILDPCNYYSKLLELKDHNGESFFQVHRFTVRLAHQPQLPGGRGERVERHAAAEKLGDLVAQRAHERHDAHVGRAFLLHVLHDAIVAREDDEEERQDVPRAVADEVGKLVQRRAVVVRQQRGNPQREAVDAAFAQQQLL